MTATHRADQTPADQDFLRLDVAFELRTLTENKRQAMDIALHPPIDLKFAVGSHIANDRQIFADGGGFRWSGDRIGA